MKLTTKKNKPYIPQVPKVPQLLAPDRVYTSPQGKIITFNDQQYEALVNIRQWIVTPGIMEYTLSGYAGTGKTTLVNAAIYDHSSVVVSAPTHKAKIVVSRATGREGQTIQALLGLKPNTDLENFDIENPQFDPLGQKLIQQYKLIVIDEASMLNRDLYELLIKEAKRFNTKLLFMGDEAQVPPVNEHKSEVFKVSSISHLTKVERQAGDNPLMKVYDSIRDNIQSKNDVFEHKTQLLYDKGIVFHNEEQEFRKMAIQAFTSKQYEHNKNHCKVICWTNSCVKNWNEIIREALIGKNRDAIEVGDLLMSYSNVLLGDKQIYNSADYEVDSVTEGVTSDEIDVYKVILIDIDTQSEYNVNIVIPETHNLEKFKRIAMWYLDKTVGTMGKARSIAWGQYFGFKSKHLLMQKVGKVDKDFEYGYAITVHKSQGSTYTQVYVDESDIDNNRKYTERNKLKYVAFSRPTDIVHSLLNTVPVEKVSDADRLKQITALLDKSETTVEDIRKLFK